MINPEKSLEEKIKSVRKQIVTLDSKREVLKALLMKLENQRAELTGEQYNKQEETAVNFAVADKNKDSTFFIQPSPVDRGDRIPYKLSISEENLQLFISLFKSRVDVFAKRWENRQGRSGYSPACRNE